MTRTLRSILIFSCVLFAATTAQAQPTLDAEQTAFLTLINNYRAANGAGPLQVSIALQNASQWMSSDMAAKNYFNHTDSLSRDPFSRMAAFGYAYPTASGENIAAGNSSAQSTFDQWKASSGHNANMLNPSYKVIGIGRAYNSASTYRWYWTTDFGGYVDAVLGGNPTPRPTISSFTATPSVVTPGRPQHSPGMFQARHDQYRQWSRRRIERDVEIGCARRNDHLPVDGDQHRRLNLGGGHGYGQCAGR
jgi:uncharacterized protein YkwD